MNRQDLDYYRKIFVCQLEQDYYPHHTCSVASCMILLKAWGMNPLPTYKELADEFGINQENMAEKNGYFQYKNFSKIIFPENVIKFFIKRNIQIRMHFYQEEWQECLKKSPIMVLSYEGNETEEGTYGHWIVVVKRNNDFFTFLDPFIESKGRFIRYMHADDFRRYYSGIAIQIVSL